MSLKKGTIAFEIWKMIKFWFSGSDFLQNFQKIYKNLSHFPVSFSETVFWFELLIKVATNK